MNSISFANVYLLFLVIPLVALVTVPFALAVRSDNRNGHNIASLVLHLVMAALIAFAAAGTSIVTVITQTEVIVVADVSYSANKNLDTVDGYINELRKNLPRNSKMGIICFGKDYKMITELGGEIKSVKESGVDDTETNIGSALTYAGSLFGEDVIKRLVLISDGRQSDLRDSNSLKRISDELSNKGVRIDAMYLDDNLTESNREIQVSRAEFTKTAFLNKAERAVAYIDSSYAVNNVRITLYSDGEPLESRVESLSFGSNAISFNLPTSEEGSFNYEIRVEGLEENEDGCSFNNAYSFTQKVSGAVSVLVMTGDNKNLELVEEVYGEDCSIVSYVGAAFAQAPYTVEELCKYDEIVLADVDVTTHPMATMLLDSLDKVVSVFGKNLITLGDLNIQANESEVIKGLGNMLPVNYGKNDEDPKLYTLVIDTSRSMETNYRQIISKQAAIKLLGQMSPADYVCVVEFNGDYRVAHSPKALGDGKAAVQAINALGVTQGTLLTLGLQAALDQMNSYTAFRQKRILLITDGLTFSAGSGANDDELKDVVQHMRMNNIKMPVVIDVGRGADMTSTESVAAQTLLKNIASWSGNPEGYKFANSLELLDSIMMDVTDDMFKMTIEGSSYLQIKRTTDETVKDLTVPDAEYEPTVGGFINNSAKSGAVTVLNTKYLDDGVYLQAPLYAYWKYGAGKVSSFTSSLGKNWASSGRWDEMGKFFKNVLTENVPSEKADYPYTVEVSTEGKYARLAISPVNLYPDATASVEVTSPDGNATVYEMTSGSTEYYADFETPDLGKYEMAITYSYGGKEYKTSAYLDLSYLAEYDSFVNFDASELYKMVGGNGVVSEDGKLKIENDDRDVGTYVMSLTVPLLAVCAGLFVVDIIIRKLKWNDIKNLFVKVNKVK